MSHISIVNGVIQIPPGHYAENIKKDIPKLSNSGMCRLTHWSYKMKPTDCHYFYDKHGKLQVDDMIYCGPVWYIKLDKQQHKFEYEVIFGGGCMGDLKVVAFYPRQHIAPEYYFPIKETAP